MLKVTVLDDGAETRVKVEGILAGPSVAELESAWKQIWETRENRKIIVDLGGTTVIDASGKRMLMIMASQGAELVAKGVYTEYVVRGLVAKVNAGCQS